MTPPVQTEVYICDGCDQQNFQGTISINVPNGTNSVSLQLRTRFDGGSDYFGVDNFLIEGDLITTDTTVQFVSSTSTLAEDGVFIDVCASITNEDAAPTTVDISLGGASTSNNGTDYDDGAGSPAAISFPHTLTFPANSNADQCLTIFISNDDAIIENDETIVLNLINPLGGNSAALGSTTQHTVTITDNDLNNTCVLATSLPVNTTCVNQSFSNVNATNSGAISPTCGGYSGGDVWFSVTVPSTGEITVETSENAGIADSVVEIYSGTCGALNYEDCNDDGGLGAMSLLTLTGLTPSTTLYIRVWEYGNNVAGTFNICVTTPTPCVAPTGQPTGLTLSNITGSSIDGSFTNTTADEYLVVQSTSATLSGNPAPGITYNNGDALGGGTVVQSSNSNTFTATGLSQTTDYYFFVFALNDTSCAGGPLYNINSPLTGNDTTISGPCLTTGFENADNWSDHSYGNWTDTDINGDLWTGNGIYAGETNRRIQMNTVGDWLELPTVDNPASLEYYGRLSSTPSGNNRIKVQYFNGSIWIDIIEHSATSTSYSLFTADLSSITALTNVRLRLYRSVDDRTHYIDDLSVYCGASTPIQEIQLVDNAVTNQNCGYIINFGNVASDGSSSDLTFDIDNIGSANLIIDELNISTGDYTIISPLGVSPTSPLTIQPTDPPIVVTVRFTPTSDETLTSTLSIVSNDSDENPCSVNLTGIGFTPGPNIIVRGVVGFDPTIANGSDINDVTPLNNTKFAQRIINLEQQTKSFRISNEGATAGLNVSGITLSGDTADFSVNSSFTNPFLIDTSQDFTITFQPTTLSGSRSVTVSVNNSDPNKNPYTFVVEGTAECPSVNGTIYPQDGPPGTTVTVLSPGNDLTNASATLNGIALTPVSSSMTKLVVRLPNTISTGGPLSVQLDNGCVFSDAFTLLDKDPTGCQTSSSGTVSDLFISEITDSPNGSLTYIELYNATGAAINFATTNYFIRIYNNGQTGSFRGLTLNSGTVANNSTYVISTGVSGSQCDNATYPGADGSLSQIELTTIGASINFSKNGNVNVGHDYIGLYSTAAVNAMTNPEGVVDVWGAFGDETWAVGLGLGIKGANFQRDTDAIAIPNTVFNTGEWIITEWSDADCSDVDYSTIGNFIYSTGVAPFVTTQPTDPVFACSFSASISVAGTEGNLNGGPPDSDLTYLWYFSAPEDNSWTPANTALYLGYNTTTLNITDTSTLNGYQYYCQIREGNNTCFTASNAVVLDVRISVWDGSWSFLPANDRVVILNANYDTTTNLNDEVSFSACNLIINDASLTIGDISNGGMNTYVEVENDLTLNGNASIIVHPQAAFVQINDSGNVSANIADNIQVIKETAPMATAQEYTYWSSPVENEEIGQALAQSNPGRRYWFNAQNYKDSCEEDNNDNNLDCDLDGNSSKTDDIDDYAPWDWQNITVATTEMQAGVGYASTHDPGGFSGPGSPPYQFDYIFNGLFNNGVKTVTLYRNDDEINDTNWNLVGNPYPSAIDVDAFFNENLYNPGQTISTDYDANSGGAIDGAIYLWSHNTAPSDTNNGNENINFTQSDYVTINGVGTVIPANEEDPGNSGLSNINRMIPSGQGFFVSMSDAVAATGSTNIKSANLVFNNVMRVKGTNDNSQFFRNGNTASLDRIWINLTSDNGIFSQILVGYKSGASTGYDSPYYDAKRNTISGAHSILYSIIQDNNQRFAIQGKNPESLNIDEVIPLGFYTSIEEATIYTLSIAQLEGGFLTNNTVYLKDYLLNTIHNLSDSDYNFASETGEFNERFEIVFTADALSLGENELDINDLNIIELQSGAVQFTVLNRFQIKTVEILDLLGRSIYRFKGQSSSEIYNLNALSNSAYIAKVTLNNNQIITKKAIKRK